MYDICYSLTLTMTQKTYIKDITNLVRPTYKARRFYSTCLLLLFPLIYTQIGHSHGGGLAADGCHNDRKNGGRHCHRNPSRIKSDNSPSTLTPINKNERDPYSQRGYDRQEWKYKKHTFTNTIGFYSGVTCLAGIDIDHVVSLKDAHHSGGDLWSPDRKSRFANDRQNLVPSCSEINRSKGASLPLNFIARADDGSGIEFDFTKSNICKYLKKYKEVKVKYQLSFNTNNVGTFNNCELSI